jgi:capsular polysaccharide biosynthesis protein
MPRAIYTEAHTQLWLDTAIALQEELGLEPCYWVGKGHFETQVLRQFPHVIFHSRTDAIRGVPPAAMAQVPQRPLDADVLRQFSRVQLAAGKMMDRLDVLDGFRFEERTRLFHVQLRYWRSVIEAIDPDLVVFPVQPHTVYDYIIYELCQAYGVRTAMFQWTVFHDWIYPLDHIEHGYHEIRDRYRRLLAGGIADVKLAPVLEEYFQRVGGDYRDVMPDYLVAQMPTALRSAIFSGTPATGDFGFVPQQIASLRASSEIVFPSWRLFASNPQRARKHASRFFNDRFHHYRRVVRASRAALRRSSKYAIRRLRHTLSARSLARNATRLARWPRRVGRGTQRLYRRYLRMPVRAVLAGDMNRPLKEPGRRMEESFRGRWGGVRLQIMRLAGNRRKRELLREYLARCAPLDFDAPYIFVALHYQPEQTTSPTGGVFVDQNIMVDMLARIVPAGWRIYVKDHPFQFFPNSIGERSRSVEFYDDLMAHSNVTLVPWSVSPFELIDHAKAVATVCGTTGIEAIMRGKPVLAFGYAWYRDCEGVFNTPSVAECRQAIQAITGGYQVDPRKVRLYLKAIEESCFRADLDFGVHIDPVPHEDNVARIAGGIRRIYERGAAKASRQQDRVVADLQVSPGGN